MIWNKRKAVRLSDKEGPDYVLFIGDCFNGDCCIGGCLVLLCPANYNSFYGDKQDHHEDESFLNNSKLQLPVPAAVVPAQGHAILHGVSAMAVLYSSVLEMDGRTPWLRGAASSARRMSPFAGPTAQRRMARAGGDHGDGVGTSRRPAGLPVLMPAARKIMHKARRRDDRRLAQREWWGGFRRHAPSPRFAHVCAPVSRTLISLVFSKGGQPIIR